MCCCWGGHLVSQPISQSVISMVLITFRIQICTHGQPLACLLSGLWVRYILSFKLTAIIFDWRLIQPLVCSWDIKIYQICNICLDITWKWPLHVTIDDMLGYILLYFIWPFDQSSMVAPLLYRSSTSWRHKSTSIPKSSAWVWAETCDAASNITWVRITWFCYVTIYKTP